MNTIYSRKSVRSYTGEKISENAFKQIIKSANAAPIGMGKYENVHLTVIENKDLLEELENNARQIFGNPDLKPFYGAPTLVLVSSKAEETLGNSQYSNAAIVVHNMGLAATEFEVGNCYIWGAIGALNQNPELVKKLNLPESFVPCCGIVLGKTEETYILREIPENRIETSYIK